MVVQRPEVQKGWETNLVLAGRGRVPVLRVKTAGGGSTVGSEYTVAGVPPRNEPALLVRVDNVVDGDRERGFAGEEARVYSVELGIGIQVVVDKGAELGHGDMVAMLEAKMIHELDQTGSSLCRNRPVKVCECQNETEKVNKKSFGERLAV
ncbi:hypothetical protein FA15DRAFT_697398 [Coprinopsis marcescibilis]|uniref:Uncharacterized protein n=1 Tax=Coprinopsis marcescibilis TaxID=230819 RepID=A0A5C3KUU4_COPMA|nr:hypothetical protein FA15DRAFT_697398 [Coprinopsis marcescibilis]